MLLLMLLLLLPTPPPRPPPAVGKSDTDLERAKRVSLRLVLLPPTLEVLLASPEVCPPPLPREEDGSFVAFVMLKRNRELSRVRSQRDGRGAPAAIRAEELSVVEASTSEVPPPHTGAGVLPCRARRPPDTPDTDKPVASLPVLTAAGNAPREAARENVRGKVATVVMLSDSDKCLLTPR